MYEESKSFFFLYSLRAPVEQKQNKKKPQKFVKWIRETSSHAYVFTAPILFDRKGSTRSRFALGHPKDSFSPLFVLFLTNLLFFSPDALTELINDATHIKHIMIYLTIWELISIHCYSTDGIQHLFYTL